MKLDIVKRAVSQSDAWLLQHRANVTSQCGEDGILGKVFEVIGGVHKVCVEFGAWDGKRHSNTNALIIQKGWSGYLIEPDATKFKALQDTYRNHPGAVLVNQFVRLERGEGTLDEILTEHRCPSGLDLVSIDIDGNDYYMWEGMREFVPKVVLIEFNPTVPNDVLFVQDKSFAVHQGCSLLALVLLGREKGYELVCATDWNALFVRKELFPLFNIRNNAIDAMYQPQMNGRIFHGYDGTIHVVDMPYLMWHGVNLTDADFQVLPESLRVYREEKG